MVNPHVPRDIQLYIVSKFDMDTRIQENVIGKLQVPQTLINFLDNLNTLHIANYKKRLQGETTHVVTLQIQPDKFYECYHDIYDCQTYWYISITKINVHPKLIMVYPNTR